MYNARAEAKMRVNKLSLICGFALAAAAVAQQAGELQEQRPRARELGIQLGRFAPGPLNAITDVPGVKVGQVTIVDGTAVRTGVTAVLPHGGNLFREKVPAAIHVFNAFGKLVGATQVEELGQIEAPIVLTNTLSVWDAAAATAEWMLRQPGNENVRSINPVVGETNDGWLNDIRGRHVQAEHVWKAIESASPGAVEEGSVGAGTGTVAFGWKGGIGTSSRRLEKNGGFTLGVLVQSNFGGNLTMDGVPVWKSLQPPRERAGIREARQFADGSCMIVVATDAPLDARQLKRLAARAIHGMARTGSSGSHGSGDYVISFSTKNRYAPGQGVERPFIRQITTLAEDELSPLFEGVIEATEEAIYNSLLRATTVRGRDGHTAEAIPIARLVEILRYRRSEEVKK
jgi:D-aminopeptidase